MSVTIFETLQNADYNLKKNGVIGLALAKEQLNNAVKLLEKGYELDDIVEVIFEKYENIEQVPFTQKMFE